MPPEMIKALAAGEVVMAFSPATNKWYNVWYQNGDYMMMDASKRLDKTRGFTLNNPSQMTEWKRKSAQQAVCRVLVIGNGFVGSSVVNGCIPELVDITIIDPKTHPGSENMTLNGEDYDLAFICVPTPTSGTDNWSCDDTMVYKWCETLGSHRIATIIKSTVPPSGLDRCRTAYEMASENYDMLAYVPEFLTERNKDVDYITQDLVIGTGSEAMMKVTQTFFTRYTKCSPKKCFLLNSLEAASFVKYGRNSFLALKVAFFNQYGGLIKSTASSAGDYDDIIAAITSDSRIGESHSKVPGPDGLPGFGGSCFPKDTKAIYEYSVLRGCDRQTILGEAITYNQGLRYDIF